MEPNSERSSANETMDQREQRLGNTNETTNQRKQRLATQIDRARER